MNMVDEARILQLVRQHPERPPKMVLGEHICKLEKVLEGMFRDWAMCHAHPGSYKTVEECRLNEYAGKLSDLGIDVSHIW